MDFVTVEAKWKFDQNHPEAVFSSAGACFVSSNFICRAVFGVERVADGGA